MEAIKLSGLEPKAFMGYFEKISTIPHGSGNIRKISDYFVSFAQEHNLRYIQDELGNVILFGEGNSCMSHTLLIMSLIICKAMSALLESLTDTNYTTVTENTEDTVNELGFFSVKAYVLIIKKLYKSLSHCKTHINQSFLNYLL